MLVSLLSVIVVLAIVGFAVWLVVTYIPMPDPMRKVIIVLVVLVLLVWMVRWLASSSLLTLP